MKNKITIALCLRWGEGEDEGRFLVMALRAKLWDGRARKQEGERKAGEGGRSSTIIKGSGKKKDAHSSVSGGRHDQHPQGRAELFFVGASGERHRKISKTSMDEMSSKSGTRDRILSTGLGIGEWRGAKVGADELSKQNTEGKISTPPGIAPKKKDKKGEKLIWREKGTGTRARSFT